MEFTFNSRYYFAVLFDYPYCYYYYNFIVIVIIIIVVKDFIIFFGRTTTIIVVADAAVSLATLAVKVWRESSRCRGVLVSTCGLSFKSIAGSCSKDSLYYQTFQ